MSKGVFLCLGDASICGPINRTTYDTKLHDDADASRKIDSYPTNTFPNLLFLSKFNRLHLRITLLGNQSRKQVAKLCSCGFCSYIESKTQPVYTLHHSPIHPPTLQYCVPCIVTGAGFVVYEIHLFLL